MNHIASSICGWPGLVSDLMFGGCVSNRGKDLGNYNLDDMCTNKHNNIVYKHNSESTHVEII